MDHLSKHVNTLDESQGGRATSGRTSRHRHTHVSATLPLKPLAPRLTAGSISRTPPRYPATKSNPTVREIALLRGARARDRSGRRRAPPRCRARVHARRARGHALCHSLPVLEVGRMILLNSVPWPAQYYATHLTPRQSKMGASLVVALKLCGGRGVYEGRKLAKFHDPRPRHRLPSTTVSAEKRPMGKEAKSRKPSSRAY